MSGFFCKSCGAKMNDKDEVCPECNTPQINSNTDFNGNPISVAPVATVEEVFCRSCGEKIRKEAEICPKCGVRQIASGPVKIPLEEHESDKSRLVALLLCLFFGLFGVHRFYAGKITSGVLQVFFGWLTFGIWPLIDLIMILAGVFKDEKGKTLTRWDM